MGNICSFCEDKPSKNLTSAKEPLSNAKQHQHQAAKAAAATKKVQKKIQDLHEDDLTSDDDDDEKNIEAVEMVEEDHSGTDEETHHGAGNDGRKKGRVLVLKKKENAPKVKTFFRTIKTSVHHVYDGDTVTLNLPDANKPGELTRVRLVGIDAPEIKEKQEGAQESKALVKQLCDKKDVEVEVDTREETDKYGRMIGRIFVTKKNGKRVNINNKVIEMGLGNVYFPAHSKAFLELKEPMLQKQKQALKNRVGIWSTFVDDFVYKTRNGGSYHKNTCEHVSKFHLDKLHRSECLEKGMSACRTCQP